MNIFKLQELIQLYKTNFSKIHNAEIYKWRAVKCFQDNWDINAQDFTLMLRSSLRLTKNLLASNNYFPQKMLLSNSEKDPISVKHLFEYLFNEEIDLSNRVEYFIYHFRELNRKNFPETLGYQDPHSVLAYLSLKYPERYYIYKFEILKNFVKIIDYPYKPIKGRIENVVQHISICNLIREEILLDNELLELHVSRLTKDEYLDSAFNMLTQDFIYACVRHLKNVNEKNPFTISNNLTEVSVVINPQKQPIVLRSSFTNYLDNEREKKKIGDLGELLVLEWEKKKLSKLGSSKTPIHISKNEGDGKGYDILSFDEHGKEMFIEVKTTVSNYNATFYITANELEKSIKDSESFFMYRVYHFDKINNNANFYVRKGSLIDLCINPVRYKIIT